MVNIVWFQFDLRIYDHLPLFDASSTGSIIPLYIYDEKMKKLKAVPKGKKHKGLRKLPKQVRNKMGYMKKGGAVK